MGLVRKISNLFVKESKVKGTVGKETPEGFPFTRFATFGAHLYREAGERCDVSFIDQKTGERRLIVDNQGNIRNFPGLVKRDFWINELTSENYLKPVVRFRTSFEKWDDTCYIMLWQIQPDGCYWADDDGFGMEDDEEIILYSFIDRNGQFMGPFQIYRVGDTRYLSRENS